MRGVRARVRVIKLDQHKDPRGELTARETTAIRTESPCEEDTQLAATVVFAIYTHTHTPDHVAID